MERDELHDDSDEDDEGNGWVALSLTFVVALIVVLVASTFLPDMGGGLKLDEEAWCQDEFGPNWTPTDEENVRTFTIDVTETNASVDISELEAREVDDSVVYCSAPNGSVRTGVPDAVVDSYADAAEVTTWP